MPLITYPSTSGTAVVMWVEYLTRDQENKLTADAAPAARMSLARIFGQMRAREARLQEAATPAQRAITWGGYWAAPQPGAPEGPYTAYGRVSTPDEVAQRNAAAGVPMSEAAAEDQGLRAGYQRGWRYGRVYSPHIPEGEYGDEHVAEMIPISAAQFEAARAAGWPAEIPEV